MPNGIFPVPTVRTTSSPTTPWSFRTRLRTRRQRARLDRQLAGGVKYSTPTPLGLRAAQLLSRAERARLANALVSAVGEARRGEPMNIRTRPQRAEVRANAAELLALAERLRESTPVDARGVAKVAVLVHDRRGPLYRPGAEQLNDVVVDAYASLIPSHELDYEAPVAA